MAKINVAQWIENRIPDPGTRTAAMDLLSFYILTAHDLAPNCWLLQIQKNYPVVFMVKKYWCYSIGGDLTGGLRDEVVAQFDRTALPSEVRQTLLDLGGYFRPGFKELNKFNDQIFIPWENSENFQKAIALIKPSAAAFLQRLLPRKTIKTAQPKTYANRQGREILDYVKELLNLELPEPGYIDGGKATDMSINKELLLAVYDCMAESLQERLPQALKHGRLGIRPVAKKINWAQYYFPEFPFSHYEVSFNDEAALIEFHFEDRSKTKNTERLSLARDLFPTFTDKYYLPEPKTRPFSSVGKTFGLEIPILRNGELIQNFQDTANEWVQDAAAYISNESSDLVGKEYVAAVITELMARFIETSYEGLKKVFRYQNSPIENPSDFITRTLEGKGYRFTPQQIAAFYTALQTKGFVILSGISGTGKTKLAQEFAAMLPACDLEPGFGGVLAVNGTTALNCRFISVRPDWRDSKPLFGYYNPITNTYEWTGFLEFVLRARQDYQEHAAQAKAWFVILDEMNLARVEYYFADLLSVLESGRDSEGWTREPVCLQYPPDAQGPLPARQFTLPPNLYFIGTVNMDETTQAFSPKVLDRAFSIEFTRVDLDGYPWNMGEQTELSEDQKAGLLEQFSRGGRFAWLDKNQAAGFACGDGKPFAEHLCQLNLALEPFDLHFGYRVFDEIMAFLVCAQENQFYGSKDEAFDAAVLMKVLPKFHGSRSKLEAPLKALLAWCLKPGSINLDPVEARLKEATNGYEVRPKLDGLKPEALYPQTFDRAARMLQALYINGFAAFG